MGLFFFQGMSGILAGRGGMGAGGGLAISSSGSDGVAAGESPTGVRQEAMRAWRP